MRLSGRLQRVRIRIPWPLSARACGRVPRPPQRAAVVVPILLGDRNTGTHREEPAPTLGTVVSAPGWMALPYSAVVVGARKRGPRRGRPMCDGPSPSHFLPACCRIGPESEGSECYRVMLLEYDHTQGKFRDIAGNVASSSDNSSIR